MVVVIWRGPAKVEVAYPCISKISLNTAFPEPKILPTNAILALYQQGTGSVLIATTTSSSTNPAIKITNLGTGDSFVIESQDTDLSPFVIDSSGRVGIATSSP
ncbi:unnamed protein product, partial [marine sediment metagenome]